jgi:hypothetical protein
VVDLVFIKDECGDKAIQPKLPMEKVYFTPQPMRVRTHHPQPMKMDFYPLKFLKQDKSPPKAVLKNYSKSQKNHKMENPTMLDSQ